MNVTTSDALRLLRDRVDFVLVNVPPFDAINGDRPLPDLDLRLGELTACFTMATFGLQLHELSFAQSHDEALARGSKDFCLIQKFGHVFHGPQDAAAALIDATEKCAFLMGHIMERGGYYYLHDQCTLVNRRAWERLGRPAFGKPDQGLKSVALPKRCAQDVHDDYTPLWLDPTGKETERDAAYGYGWHGISESLKAGIQVTNWNDAVRRWKHYCYAYYGNPGEWQRTLGDVLAATHTDDGGLRLIVDFLKQAARAAVPDDRIPLLGSNVALDVPAVRFKSGLDCLLASARGFNANQVLEAVGFDNETKVVFYDRSDAVLAFKRHTIETWDGENLATFIADARREIARTYPNVTLELPENLTDGHDNGAVYRDLGLIFESKESWLRHWHSFKKLRHEFVILDPLRQPAAMAACIQAHAAKSTIAAIDDCFDSLDGIMLFDWARRKSAYDALVQSLKSTSQVYLVIGTPPRRRIRG